jgi:NAD(P)-dependent dehydrogenase (short-subunit alcohol dehydrogenase family)
MDLITKSVLITGGRRVGAAIARELAQRGADVALTFNRSRTEAEQTVAAIRALGRRAIAIEANLAEPAACQRAVEETARAFGRLDVLVNMASRYGAKSFDDLGERDWRGQIAIDLDAAFHCARAAVPYLRQQGGGRIVNFGDWVAASRRPRYKGYLPYYVAKAGVIALSEALALELASDGILVNAIAPGPVLAPDDLDAEAAAEVVKNTPLGRWGGEGEIVKAVLLLVETDFITGETIRVDGGRHLL